MKARLLSTVAASLLIGIGAASAQSPTQQQAPERAPAAQQSAPAEKVAPPMKGGERKAPETTGQASPDSKMDKGTSGSMNKSSETSGQAPKAGDQDKTGSGMKSSSEPKASDSKSPSMKSTTDSNKADTTKGAASDTTKTQNNVQGTTSTQSTTGQGAASGQVKLSTEQRAKITSVIKSQKVERVEPSKLNIQINVGTKIPSSVRVHRLPAEVVTIYPEWRGYDYILVGDQIIIVEPRTHEIVFIIEA